MGEFEGTVGAFEERRRWGALIHLLSGGESHKTLFYISPRNKGVNSQIDYTIAGVRFCQQVANGAHPRRKGVLIDPNAGGPS